MTAAVTVPAGEATHLALVMAQGPGRGAFEVSVDGVVSSTVDTYAGHLRPRVVTWQVALRSGTHTVRGRQPGHRRSAVHRLRCGLDQLTPRRAGTARRGITSYRLAR